jgi:hypothetical protein
LLLLIFFSCARTASSTILLSCYPVNYGFFFLPAQVVWQGVNFRFESGALEEVRPVLYFARIAQFAVGWVFGDFTPVQVVLQDVVSCCESELGSGCFS